MLVFINGNIINNELVQKKRKEKLVEMFIKNCFAWQ